LSESLDRAIVLAGDASDRELLLEENIEETDVFCAVTNDDEANIMSAMLAKSLGARKVIALINNPAYVDLIEGSNIDIAISPQQATLGSILTHIRRGDVVKVHSLRRGAAEAIEAIAHGDRRSSKVVGRKIEEIDLPRALILAPSSEVATLSSLMMMSLLSPMTMSSCFWSTKAESAKSRSCFRHPSLFSDGNPCIFKLPSEYLAAS